MKYIKKFYEYKQYEKLITINENDLFYTFVDYYYNSELISNNDRNILESYTNYSLSEYLINENFFDKLKDRYDKAATVVKNIPDNAKNALNSIIDAAKTSVEFVKNLVSQLNVYIKKMITVTSDNIKNKLKIDQNFIKQIKETNAKNKNGLLNDMKECKNVVSFYKDKLTGILSTKLTTAFTQVVTSEDLPVEEKINYMKESLTMGKNVISSLIHGIEKVPPFSWLGKVKEMAEKGVNSVVAALSYFTQQLGGPKIEIPVIASLLAIAFEYNVKGLAKHGLLEIIGLATLPAIAILIKTIAYIATFVAAILVIDDVCGLNILVHGHGHGNEQEVKTAPKETATTPVTPKATPVTPTPNKTETETETKNPAASAALASATPIK
ncbi:hypothetical protein M0Q97_13475 [Candidatus Dojkabacteria bacterium]|jgi:hypothetical protein|nr:hypothetical protein [Candidatus Dojkabacteria bacterium]